MRAIIFVKTNEVLRAKDPMKTTYLLRTHLFFKTHIKDMSPQAKIILIIYYIYNPVLLVI